MFLRMLVRAAVLRRGRAASALLAMVVAAAVATAMLNLYVDVQAKLRREFRKYGANIVVAAKAEQGNGRLCTSDEPCPPSDLFLATPAWRFRSPTSSPEPLTAIRSWSPEQISNRCEAG